VKVKDIIAQLNNKYSADDEVMFAYWDSSYKETSDEVWSKAVEIFDSEDNRYQMSDYISDVITDAEIFFEKRKEQAELGIDSYLHDLAEKELDNENV
jgi:hypothetical protein